MYKYIYIYIYIYIELFIIILIKGKHPYFAEYPNFAGFDINICIDPTE